MASEDGQQGDSCGERDEDMALAMGSFVFSPRNVMASSGIGPFPIAFQGPCGCVAVDGGVLSSYVLLRRIICLQEGWCGAGCRNRLALVGCDPALCGFGAQDCGNRFFDYCASSVQVELFNTHGDRGMGLKSKGEIACGTFVMEYSGKLYRNTDFAGMVR